MSEMLGNHYFLSRNFSQAINAYSSAFQNVFPDKVIKKLIICYITQGDIDVAEEYFLKLIKSNPSIIINTEITDEECPCLDIINNLENKSHSLRSIEDYIGLGILWFYYDTSMAQKYFDRAQNIDTKNKFIQEIQEIIKNKLSLNKKG